MRYVRCLRETQLYLTSVDAQELLSQGIYSLSVRCATFLPMLSYLCKAGFLVVDVIKMKYLMKMSVEEESRVAMSNLMPKFKKSCST